MTNLTNLQPHQQRVVDEKAELDARLNALLAFTAGMLFATLDAAEQKRLRQQAAYMQAYSNILAQRIDAFPRINQNTALARFVENTTSQPNMTPLERLRFFCSLAMNGQDWMDAGPFFIALEEQLKGDSHD